MVFSPISDCLSKNQELLGSSYNRLGRLTSCTWFGRKIFLSFDQKTGWSVVTLGLVQRFLRNCFGFYKSTRLETVFHAWKDLTRTSSYKNPELKKRLESYWYTAQRFFATWGNSKASEAAVFCFPERHTDKEYRKAVNNFINNHYREGDIVLTEGEKAGCFKRNQQVKYLDPAIPVAGWEPDNYEEIHSKIPFIREHRQMLDKIDAFSKEFLSIIHAEEPYDAIQSSLDNIIIKLAELAAYFDPSMSKQRIEDVVHMMYQECKTKEKPCVCFAMCLMTGPFD